MKYADLSKAHRDLKKVPYDENDSSKNDDYWAAQEAFKLKLKEAMRDDELLKKLTRPQLLKICAWCSTYRPLEPHVCLSTLGRLADEPNKFPKGELNLDETPACCCFTNS